MVESQTPTHGRRRSTLTKRLLALAALIGAVFAVPIAVQKGLDGLHLWQPIVDWATHKKKPVENVEMHESSLYFLYKNDKLVDVGTLLPGAIALDARDPNRRFSIGCSVDGAEAADPKVDASALSVARANYVRSKLIEVGVSPSQILPGLDRIDQAVVEPGVRDPLNRRCVTRSIVLKN